MSRSPVLRTAAIGLAAAVAGLALAGCQSTQSRQQQLAQICADPSNRAAGSDYYFECQTLYPISNAQRSKLYYQTAAE